MSKHPIQTLSEAVGPAEVYRDDDGVAVPTGKALGPGDTLGIAVYRPEPRLHARRERHVVPHHFKRVEVGPPPSPNRKEYPFEGTIDFQGLAIDVENRKGGVREGVSEDGTPWRVVMRAHYGEFRGSKGVDGDPVDVYVGPNAVSPVVVVVKQQDPRSKRYDEDKIMVGFDNAADAVRMFRRHYDRRGFYLSHKVTSIGWLAAWLRDRRTDGKAYKGGSRGGPYIGPRGGRWADPQHTIPWREAGGWSGLRDELVKRHNLSKLGTEYNASENHLRIGMIAVEPEHRGRGHGQAAMVEILQWADRTGTTITLTPTSEHGGSKARLTRWYKSLGFVPNSGRYRDYRFRDAMLREPNVAAYKGGSVSALTEWAAEVIKGASHKYIKRTGTPGNYRYFYEGDVEGGRGQMGLELEQPRPQISPEKQAALEAIRRRAGDPRLWREREPTAQDQGIAERTKMARREAEKPRHSVGLRTKLQGLDRVLSGNAGWSRGRFDTDRKMLTVHGPDGVRIQLLFRSGKWFAEAENEREQAATVQMYNRRRENRVRTTETVRRYLGALTFEGRRGMKWHEAMTSIADYIKPTDPPRDLEKGASMNKLTRWARDTIAKAERHDTEAMATARAKIEALLARNEGGGLPLTVDELMGVVTEAVQDHQTETAHGKG